MLTQKELNDLLEYNPLTGELRWKFRNSEKFSSVRMQNSWNKKHVGKLAFTADNGRGYKQGTIDNVMYKAHRVIFALVYGYWPNQVDHIDHNRSNNRLVNLREVSNNENQKNAKLRANNTSKQVGVSWEKSTKKWLSRIGVNGVKITLGRFSSKDEAICVRLAAEKQYGYHPNHGKT